MREAILTKHLSGALVPSTPQDVEMLSGIKIGEAVRVKWSKARNVQFHRKFFALMNLAFDSWEPPVVGNKNFDRFRKDITILAGYYSTVVNIRGDVRAEADSISFSSMDEDTFATLYSNVLDVLLKRVLVNYTKADVDRVVAELMEFA